MNVLLLGDTVSELGLLSVHVPKALGFQLFLDEIVDIHFDTIVSVLFLCSAESIFGVTKMVKSRKKCNPFPPDT